MTERDRDTELDGFFAAAAAEAPLPSGEVLARIEAQALAEQPRPAARRAPLHSSALRQLLSALGGWPAAAGLAAACAAGVWFGVNPPDALLTLYDGTLADLSDVAVDPLGSYDLAWLDG